MVVVKDMAVGQVNGSMVLCGTAIHDDVIFPPKRFFVRVNGSIVDAIDRAQILCEDFFNRKKMDCLFFSY